MKIFLLLLLFLSTSCWGNTIKMTEDSSIYGCYSESCLNELLVETSTASGTNSTKTVYIPFYDSVVAIGGINQPNIEYSLFSVVKSGTDTAENTLPSYSPNFPDNPSVIKHQFTIATPENESYLYAGLMDLQDSSNKKFYIINPGSQLGLLNQVIPKGSNANWQANLKIYALCNISQQSPCSGLEFDSPSFNSIYTKENVKIYFFLSPTTLNLATTPTGNIDDYPTGIYFQYILSNSVSPNPPNLNSVAKGDERVKVYYSGVGINFLNDVIAIKYTNMDASTEQQTYFDALLAEGVIASKDNGANISGSVNIKNLVNGETVKVGLAYVNKFYFASEISPSEAQTPETIQTFLQEKECYLLSAGFQREHYVLEYFRSFRDKILLKNSLGRNFVQWYYNTAPVYAKYIYDRTFLRNIVKGFGYFAYYTLRFFPFLLSIILIPLIFFTFKNFSPIKK